MSLLPIAPLSEPDLTLQPFNDLTWRSLRSQREHDVRGRRRVAGKPEGGERPGGSEAKRREDFHPPRPAVAGSTRRAGTPSSRREARKGERSGDRESINRLRGKPAKGYFCLMLMFAPWCASPGQDPQTNPDQSSSTNCSFVRPDSRIKARSVPLANSR